MFQVPYEALLKSAGHGSMSYSAEASELGFPVGQWPLQLDVPRLGNGNPFVLSTELRGSGNELGGYVYYQRHGCLKITVFND